MFILYVIIFFLSQSVDHDYQSISGFVFVLSRHVIKKRMYNKYIEIRIYCFINRCIDVTNLTSIKYYQERKRGKS